MRVVGIRLNIADHPVTVGDDTRWNRQFPRVIPVEIGQQNVITLVHALHIGIQSENNRELLRVFVAGITENRKLEMVPFLDLCALLGILR